MTDEVFRIIIAVAVGLACLMFVVQAFVMFGLLKTVRKMERRLQPLTHRAEVVFENLGLASGRLAPMVENATRVMEKLGPVIEKIGPSFEKIAPFIDKLE